MRITTGGNAGHDFGGIVARLRSGQGRPFQKLDGKVARNPTYIGLHGGYGSPEPFESKLILEWKVQRTSDNGPLLDYLEIDLRGERSPFTDAAEPHTARSPGRHASTPYSARRSSGMRLGGVREFVFLLVIWCLHPPKPPRRLRAAPYNAGINPAAVRPPQWEASTMGTRIVRVWDDEREVERRIMSFSCPGGGGPGASDPPVGFELLAEERYVVWPRNPRARPKLRGRACTFRRLAAPRADHNPGDPVKARVFFDDGSWAAVDVTDLVPEAFYRSLAEGQQREQGTTES